MHPLNMSQNDSETTWRTRHISVKALWMHLMARRGIKCTNMPIAGMAADSLTKGLGASHLPRIREDLKIIEDEYVMVKLNVAVFIAQL